MPRRNRPARFALAARIPDKHFIPRRRDDFQLAVLIYIADRRGGRHDMFRGDRPAVNVRAVAFPREHAIVVRADDDI